MNRLAMQLAILLRPPVLRDQWGRLWTVTGFSRGGRRAHLSRVDAPAGVAWEVGSVKGFEVIPAAEGR